MIPTPSIIYDSSEHVLGKRSYLLSIYVVLTLKDILRRSFFVSDGSKEHINGALNVVDFSIFSSFLNIGSYHSDLRGILNASTMQYGVVGFVGRLISLCPIF